MEGDQRKPSPCERMWIWNTITNPSCSIVIFTLTLALTIVYMYLKIPSSIWIHNIVPAKKTCSLFYNPKNLERKVVASIKEFGGVGDGETSNTQAFQRAIDHLKRFGDRGGSKLIVPKGRWVTGSFNLTSNFTLYLEQGAVILGSQEPTEWPVIEALPSYGRGRERSGGRHISLLHGYKVNDLVITGRNGSIDGRGRMWWEMWWNRTLQHTRGHLLELLDSDNILIYNVTFLNSPFWTIHPVYCRDVVIKDVTILAPLHAPNTDGIDPDSSSRVCIEDCYVESGDDLVAIKSGWDQYGTKMGRPSSDIIIRRLSGTTPTCSGVGIGSEMSGGIHDVIVEDLHVWDSAAGIRVKTDRGRGGYIANITITHVVMERVKIPIRFSRGSDDHPDDNWDRKAVPVINVIVISNVVGVDIKRAPLLRGLQGTGIKGVRLTNISFKGIAPQYANWHCQYVAGCSRNVFPPPCLQLKNNLSSCT